jgi:hypothetical protein
LAFSLLRWWQAKLRNEDRQLNADHAATVLSVALERFAEGCALVAEDEGLDEMGQTDDSGCHREQVEAPRLDFDQFKVEWKALPKDLMYRVLDFPTEIEATRQAVIGKGRFADPPYDWYFMERQVAYARLGIAACGLTKELRAHASLPGRPPVEDNPEARMQKVLANLAPKLEQRAQSADF